MSAQSSLFVCGRKFGPRVRAKFDSSRLARKLPAREHTKLKGVLRFRRPARNSARTPRGRTTLLASIRRGLLGFAGQASHSGRSSLPIRLAMFREKRSFQLHASKTPPDALLLGTTTPNETQSIGEKFACVKSHSQRAEENFRQGRRTSTKPACPENGVVRAKIGRSQSPLREHGADFCGQLFE